MTLIDAQAMTDVSVWLGPLTHGAMVIYCGVKGVIAVKNEIAIRP
jgi:hypothetical protein